MITKALVVTRHTGLVEHLRNIGLIGADAQVLEHASEEDILGRDVIGVLPHSLSCLCASFTEIPLALPADMRGKELTVEDVAKYAGEPVTYQVTRMNVTQGFKGLTAKTCTQLAALGIYGEEEMQNITSEQLACLKKKARQEVLDLLVWR